LSKFSHFLGDTANALGLDDSDGESPETGDVFWAVAGAYPTAILVVIPVKDIMAAIFDAPVTPVGFKDTLGVGLVWGATGNAVGKFTRLFPGLFFYGLPFDDEGLSDVGEVEVLVEFRAGPDLADFDPAMVRRRTLNEVGFKAVLEV
jgi:hypothetical protein